MRTGNRFGKWDNGESSLPAEEGSAMRIEYAAQLLARGASPGEVAAQMGYCSGAYFSQKFRAATGHTPSAYRRIQQGLPARRQNRQQKGKSESKTPIARLSAMQPPLFSYFIL